ncbi:MAG: hypothetical protein Q7O66_07225 [Dehalococcoidia bacterium]|nr:hypothetical protein [Dehalococcoidia bacterium]
MTLLEHLETMKENSREASKAYLLEGNEEEFQYCLGVTHGIEQAILALSLYGKGES